MRKLLIICSALLCAANAHAESGALSYLQGRWEGTATKSGVELTAVECVSVQQDGRVAVINGQYRKRADNAVTTDLVGLFAQVGKTAAYRFNLYISDAATPGVTQTYDTHVDVNLETRTVNWGFQTGGSRPTGPSFPGAQIEYTMTVTPEGDAWTETGKISMDGGRTFAPFFESHFKKVGDRCE